MELQQDTCPSFWFSFNGRCYKYFNTETTWADAELYCVSQGGNLVSIHSREEEDFVKFLIKSSDPAEGLTWIGLHDIAKEGRWMWSDGCAAKYLFWYRGQPNNSGRDGSEPVTFRLIDIHLPLELKPPIENSISSLQLGFYSQRT
ncbi:hypothetical protein F7725_012348 [Dissostichus mawsoni]|uniref:C-type lectin domain-containing protein n=1 Tax=Dissostichus mawsoni TaxID=36200 RepID=A0A7J5YM34_DISMA|nr:hypothetical protein F7725_012348 [Dissostichus mawsoni]